MQKYRGFYWIMLAWSPVIAAGTAHPATVARVVVTTNSYYQGPPALTSDDLIVTDGYKPLPITALVPLRDSRADLELYVLVDNCSNSDSGERFVELREFLNSQPPTTSIGLAYIRDGRLEIVQRPTYDRARAIQALNRPSIDRRMACGRIPPCDFDGQQRCRSWRQRDNKRIRGHCA